MKLLHLGKVIYFSILLGSISYLVYLNNAIEPRWTHGEFDTFLERFSNHSESYGKRVDASHIFFITFKEDRKKYIGVCHYASIVPVIEINRSYWKTASMWDRESLVFHELGHCLLQRKHRNDLLSDGCPVSIMHEYFELGECLPKHHREYIRELFTYREKGVKF